MSKSQSAKNKLHGVWLRVKEPEISAALWAVWFRKDFSFTFLRDTTSFFSVYNNSTL